MTAHWCAWVGFGADTGKPRPHDVLSGFPHSCSTCSSRRCPKRVKKVVRSSLFPRIDVKNIDREVQPKRSSFSGKMEVAKPFLCSKLSSKSC